MGSWIKKTYNYFLQTISNNVTAAKMFFHALYSDYLLCACAGIKSAETGVERRLSHKSRGGVFWLHAATVLFERCDTMAYLAASHCIIIMIRLMLCFLRVWPARSLATRSCVTRCTFVRGAYATLPPIYNANSRQPQSFCHYGDDKPFFSL